MFKKFFLTMVLIFALQGQIFANNVSESVNNVLSSFDFDRDSVVSISVRDRKTNEVVYEKNPYKFLNPASSLKLFTMNASMQTLGEDFSFDTAVFSDDKNNLYIKLSGDPLLKESDLYQLAKNINTFFLFCYETGTKFLFQTKLISIFLNYFFSDISWNFFIVIKYHYKVSSTLSITS